MQPYYFYLNESLSPTYYNLSQRLQALGWQACQQPEQADFGESHFQFDRDATEQLEFKHRLAELITANCPELMPLTYCIHDQNWPIILQVIADRYYFQDVHYIDERPDLVWILKPALLNNGQGIKIFQRLSQIEQHFLSNKRWGGEHVLQQYIVEPDLLRGHYKYSIRLFVVATNYAGSFLYPDGYFNVALNPYSSNDFNDIRPHLTNEHLTEQEVNVVQIPAQRFAHFNHLYLQLKEFISQTMGALVQRYPEAFEVKQQRQLAILGFDFMLDKNQQPWLLEVNHGPCFPTTNSHPLQSYLYDAFWQDFIASFVLPIAKNSKVESIEYQQFTLLNDIS